MKIKGYDTTKAQRGWVCDCYYTVTTAQQFSDEERVVRGHGRWMWLAMLRSYLAVRKAAAQLQAKPGEREAKGWAP